MSNFNEYVFLRALTERPEDAKQFGQVFQPEWLRTAELRPILSEIYEFTAQHSTPPNIRVLRDIFEKRDKTMYEARLEAKLDQMEKADADVADVIYTLDRAKNVAVSWSLQDLLQTNAFLSMIEDFDGPELMKLMQRWMAQFDGHSDDVELNIREAFEDLVKLRGWKMQTGKIPCGVGIVDKWTNGGLRPKQTGILLAPTGHGKSIFLTIVAFKCAAVQGKRVLFVTNELAWDEVAERFMSLMSGKELNVITEDPSMAAKKFERHWKLGIDEKLRLIDVSGREVDTNYIEGMVGRYINLYGWAPEVLVVDYMENMKPATEGYRRDQTWMWYGAIANDLVRSAKRNNWVVWTACQFNRGAYSEQNEMSTAFAQGSIRHIQKADAVIGMRKTTSFPLPDENATILQFKNMKQRQNKNAGESVLVEAYLGKMLITDEYHEPSEWTNTNDDDDSSGLNINYDKTTGTATK